MTEIREDEYLDSADGLIHCRKCGGPRQTVIPDPFKGGTFKPRCVCPHACLIKIWYNEIG